MASDTVHYIWMGDLSTKNKKICCALGPKTLSLFSPEIEIKMWVPAQLMREAKEIFREERNINIISIETLLNKGKAGELQYITPTQTTKTENILKKQNEKKMYAGQKDLISYLILAEYGGYYFDTTTRFTRKPDLPPIENIKILTIKDADYPWYAVDVWAFAARPGHPERH